MTSEAGAQIPSPCAGLGHGTGHCWMWLLVLGRRALAASGAHGTPVHKPWAHGVPLHGWQQGGSASSAAPSCARSQPSQRIQCPQRSWGAIPGQGMDVGPSRRLPRGTAPVLWLNPKQGAVREERGSATEGSAPGVIAPGTLLAPCSYLRSLPAACPYKGTGTAPTASCLACAPPGAWNHRAGAAPLCHSHPASPMGTALAAGCSHTSNVHAKSWRAAEAGMRLPCGTSEALEQGQGTSAGMGALLQGLWLCTPLHHA